MKRLMPVLIAIIFCIILIGGFILYINKISPDNEKNEFAEPRNLTEAEAQLSDDQLKEEIGQMIMTGFRGTEITENSDAYKMIKDVKVGGVVLFDYDVPSNSFPRNIINYNQTKKLISDIQGISATALFVAIDAEGGNVNRLKPEYGFLPIISEEKMGKDKTLKITDKESTKLALELKDLGFNMNLAPVIDVNINPKNPIIGGLGRSFSSDPKEVVRHAEVFIKNHLNNGVITVEKHFPGHGSATEDSHNKAVDVTDTYKPEELLPYQNLNNEGLLKAVMTAHVINKKIDKNYPASLSSAFLQNILRNQIGFKGIIISDDMQMAAISGNYKPDEAIIMAINAGVDLVAVLNNSPGKYDKDSAYKVRDIILSAVKDGKITEQRITESYNRVLNLKKEFNIIRAGQNN